MNILGVLLGTVIGGIITISSNYILEKQKLKKEIFLKNKEKIDNAYLEIFNSLVELKKHYYLFIQPGNEFKESENYENFGPLTAITNFLQTIEKNEIYLNKNFMEEYEKFLEKIRSHPSIALALRNSPDLFSESGIENLSENTLKDIQNFLSFMKERFEEKI